MATDMNQPPKTGGGPSVLAIVLIVLGVLALICCGVCGGSLLFGYRVTGKIGNAIQNQVNAMQQIQPAQEAALDAIRQDEQCKELLGENIESVMPAIYTNAGEVDTSDAPFTFAVKGDKEVTASVSCRAKQVDAVWQVTEITVEVGDKKFAVEPLKDVAPELKFDLGDEAMPEDKKAEKPAPPSESSEDTGAGNAPSSND